MPILSTKPVAKAAAASKPRSTIHIDVSNASKASSAMDMDIEDDVASPPRALRQKKRIDYSSDEEDADDMEIEESTAGSDDEGDEYDEDDDDYEEGDDEEFKLTDEEPAIPSTQKEDGEKRGLLKTDNGEQKDETSKTDSSIFSKIRDFFANLFHKFMALFRS